MGGSKNDVLVGKNADFSQAGAPNATTGESNGLATNGQLWIGTTALNAGSTHVNVGAITSSTLTVGYSSPNITINSPGGVSSSSFDVQANTAPGTDPVVPTAAGLVTVNGAAVANHSVVLETRSRAANAYNLEVQYGTSAAATDATKSGVAHFNSAQFSVDASGFVSSLATTDLHAPRFIVSAGGASDGANYTTIATAYAAAVTAVAPQTVFIQPGTYTENITLTPGINLTAFGCDQMNPTVTIVGKLTYTGVGDVSICGICLRTNGDFALSVTGTETSQVNLINCNLDATGANAIQFTSSNGGSKIECWWCVGDLDATRAYVTHSGAGKLAFYNCTMENDGASTTASTISGSGTINILNSYWNNAITTSSTAGVVISNSETHGIMTLGGVNASQNSTNSSFEAGSSTAISISAGVTMTITNCSIDSTNAAVIGGAGVLIYSGLTFPNTSSAITTTTQTIRPEGPSRTIGSSNSGATNTLTVTNSSNTASSNASIVATVGGTSAADAFYQAVVSGTTTWSWGVDNSDTDSFVISASATPGTTNAMRISTAGEVNLPLQPAFMAYLGSTVSNVTGTGTSFTLGTTTALTEVFDQNSDFATSGTFTAPVTGLYVLSVTWRSSGIVASTNGNINIVTSNRSYSAMTQNPLNVQSSGSGWKPNSVVFADMDSGDTATFTFSASGEGGDVIDIIGAANPTTFCYGYLAC